MAEFSVRSDSVDVEQIMRQIRARIREKRGADYTEAELQQLANVKLEKFLDPRGLRSDLVEQFRRHRVVSPEPPKYEFEDTTLYETHRGVLRSIRKLLNPILKLFINPNPLIHALHVQKNINAEFHKRFRQREEMEPLYYEVIHNLVVELTRAGIEVHNLKMRVESLASRVEFDERRSRALESVVQYRKPVGSSGSAGSAGSPRASESESRGSSGQSRTSDSESRSQSRASDSESRGSGSGSPGSTGSTGSTGPAAGVAPMAAQPGGQGQQGQAGQPGQGQGERRRRRRRRRRRPGQTGADRGLVPGSAGPAAADAGPAPGAGSDEGDYDDGPDDGEDSGGPEGTEGPSGSTS